MPSVVLIGLAAMDMTRYTMPEKIAVIKSLLLGSCKMNQQDRATFLVICFFQ